MEQKEKMLVVVSSEKDNENGLVVKDYDNLLRQLCENLNDFLANHPIIATDIEIKEVKNYRTLIRKTKDKLEGERDIAVAQFVGTFFNQCMSMEKEIDKADKELKSLVDDYCDRDKPKLITLEIKSYDMANIQAVIDFATKLGLETKVK